MDLLCLPDEKSAVSSLNSDSFKAIAPPAFGEGLPLAVGIVSRIVSPTGARVFNPLSWSGWSGWKAAIGNGYVAPVAGVFYLLSGIALTSGTVTLAKRFKIVSFQAGDVFTNIGAGSNATGVVFTSSGTTPTTWTHGSELQEITANLAFNASTSAVETALNATAWITAAGGLTVSSDGTLYYFFTFTAAGSRVQIESFAENLEPLSIVEMGTLIDGDVSEGLQEVQTMRIFQNAGAFVNLDGDSDAVAVDVATVQAGGGGFNAKYRVTIAPAPYDGAFSIIVRGIESAMIGFDTTDADFITALEGISATSGLLVTGAKYKIVTFATGDDFANVGGTNVTGNVFTASGTTPTTWTHASVLSPVGSGNVTVTNDADNQWLIVFKGEMANTALGTITGDASALQVVAYKTGTLSLNTPGIELLLGSASSIGCFLVVTAVPPGATLPREIVRIVITVNAAVIDPASETPTPRVLFYTAAQCDARFALLTVAGKYRIKANGTFELWNADQAAWCALTVAGALGAEILNIAAGEA